MTIDSPADWLPHRGLMLLVDRAYDIEPGKQGTGELFLGEDDPRFHGHFPEHPILPGIFLIEAVIQTGALVLLADKDSPPGPREGFLAHVDRFKFLAVVGPSTRLTIHARIAARFDHLVKIRGEVRAGDQLVASGEVVLQITGQPF